MMKWDGQAVEQKSLDSFFGMEIKYPSCMRCSSTERMLEAKYPELKVTILRCKKCQLVTGYCE